MFQLQHSEAGQKRWLSFAEHDGEIIALVRTSIKETRGISILVPQRHTVISDLVVKEEGISPLRGLLERAEQWAAERGAKYIALVTWEFNGVLRFLRETRLQND